MKFNDYKIKEFLEDLASDSPSPGGGSTAALVASLSGCLNNMVYSLTINKKSFDKLTEDQKSKMINLEKECKNFIKNSINFMEEDRECFNKLMDSYKLPKESEEEINYRKKEIRERTYEAMYAPLKLCRECIDFYSNIEFALEYGNKMLASDAGVSASLLHSAIESSILNVKINLNSLRNEVFFKEIDEEIKITLEKSREKKDYILNKLDSLIYN
ncbi:cyclodeaminase/cyclohydrolase family protein [Eubacterium multiforme]|uniref:Formiminotetrahydrofolate cyclodeaminase n=1 Tax=Eubacterium multiforme TaxID=83339 RepID=A0ABT9USL7_9FIRM|nr:cyclodeaminase/cyclohydrolase family protein [Eubacterium multiforme]MDQ0149316.1 formiminotetrahydrofolate cyclodeaminase [Eubacterium multiforme]